jgi:hypothetical protein
MIKFTFPRGKKVFLLITELIIFITLAVLQGCVSVARLSDFPKSAEEIDFNKIASSKIEGKGPKNDSEYYIKTSDCTDSLIMYAITKVLNDEKFTFKIIEKANRVVLSERGMRANEWYSVVGVYYNKDSTGFQIYVRYKITQDITGGWSNDRSKKIADKICSLLNKCTTGYSISTRQKH